jgi:hypothetical protein
MGMFDETAIVDHTLSFEDQGKQTSLFNFGLQQTNGGLPISIFFLQQTNGSCHFPLVLLSVFIYMLPFQMENGKRN